MEKELSKLDVLYSVATMDERIHGYTRITVEKAMDEYAKQKAITFKEWAASENWQSYDSSETWINLQEGRKVLNTENLYQLYSSQVNKQL